jgi:serine/threonine protein kinase
MMALLPGDIIAGKYRVDRVLGRGGMGVVVAAEHITLRQKVAVKFLLPEAISRPGAPERFLREARSAVAIQSEHVARVIDVGTLSTGAPFIVMEYLTGTDLSQVLQARGALPVEEAIDYVLQACEAIAEAHVRGVIHRDLKPANLFLTTRADGSELVKVLDFGLSKATRPDAPGALELSLTATNTMLGSPHYMSPEQVRNLKSIDGRTDIWALGVILYQLLTAHRPFEDESLGGLFMMIGGDPPTPIGNWRSELPAELGQVIMRCLEKDPAARPQTVAELARGLAPFGSVDSRVSVERIMRVLSDKTPLPPARPSQPPPYPDDHRSAPPGKGVRGGADSTTAMASTVAQGELGSQDRPNTQRALPRPPRSAVPLIVGAVIGLVLLGTVVLFVFRSSVGAGAIAQGAPAPSASVEAPPTVTPESTSGAPSVEAPAPLPSATAVVDPPPGASASASASAPAAPPLTSAVSKPAPVKPRGTAPVQPGGKKNPGDPMDRWR